MGRIALALVIVAAVVAAGCGGSKAEPADVATEGGDRTVGGDEHRIGKTPAPHLLEELPAAIGGLFRAQAGWMSTFWPSQVMAQAARTASRGCPGRRRSATPSKNM